MPGCAWATEVRSSWDLLEDQRTFLETDRYKTSYLLHVSLERFECVFDRRIIFSKANIFFSNFRLEIRHRDFLIKFQKTQSAVSSCFGKHFEKK